MSGKHILIVDDEPDIAEVMGDRLKANGFRVETVESARACYAAVAQSPPGLILMDIQMPEISGMEALAELKATHPEIPILMVTASTVQAAAKEAEEKGAEGFLLKPYEPGELVRWVREILELEA